MNGIKKTKWPARMQFISKNVLIDAAHNPDGFRILKYELLIIKKQKNIGNFICVLGMQSDKNIQSMLNIIKPLVSSVIFTKSANPKAANPEYLLQIFNNLNKNKKINRKIINNPKKAVNYAKKLAGKNDLVVAAGSIYMIGELI